MVEIQSVVKKQREYFKSGATLKVGFRIEALKKLYTTVKKYESEISEALKQDLGKNSKFLLLLWTMSLGKMM